MYYANCVCVEMDDSVDCLTVSVVYVGVVPILSFYVALLWLVRVLVFCISFVFDVYILIAFWLLSI